MENKRFYTATDVKELLNVSLSYAYKLIRRLNAEQEAKGLVTIKGRIEAKADACSQDDFIRNMKQKGWHVIWKPTRKNITFVNAEGKKVRDRNILKTFNINVTKGELLDEFIRNDERRNGVMRDDEEERNRRAAEDAELAGYYQQVQDALEGTGTGDSAEGIEDITTGEVVPGERRSIREALTTKGRTKGALGVEDRKREEQLPVPEQQAKRNRRRAR